MPEISKLLLPVLAGLTLLSFEGMAQDAPPQTETNGTIAPAPVSEQSSGQMGNTEAPRHNFLESQNQPYTPPPPKTLAYVYSPDYCEFQVAFPEEPMITEHCDGGDDGKQCYNKVSFTNTFGLTATVYANVICNKIDQSVKANYDEAVMTKTLELMSQGNVKSQYHTSFSADEQGRYKMANLVGELELGMTSAIYLAQMWIGEHSAMTVEVQLMGEPYEEADGMFRDILRSVKYKDEAAATNTTNADTGTTNPAP